MDINGEHWSFSLLNQHFWNSKNIFIWLKNNLDAINAIHATFFSS